MTDINYHHLAAGGTIKRLRPARPRWQKHLLKGAGFTVAGILVSAVLWLAIAAPAVIFQ